MDSKVSRIFILLFIETLAFLLIFIFLIAERTYSILATFIMILLSGYLVRRIHSIRQLVRNLFYQHRIIALIWSLLFLFLLPVFLKKNPYQIYILFYAGVFALLALGLNWQIGGTNIVNFATGASFATGAYTAALLAKHLGLSFWILLPISGLAAGALGVILGLPCMKTERYYLSLVTIAFTLIIYLLLNNLGWTGGPDGIADIPFPRIGSYSFGSPIRLFGLDIPFQANFYYLTLFLVILTFIVAQRFHHSKIGLAWNAIRDDEIAAECQGIDVNYYKIISFATNFFFDGVAGAVFAFNMSHISPESFTFNVSVTVVAMVIVGGLGNPGGTIFGVLLMTIIPEKFQIFQNYRVWMFGFVILLMLFIRPKGLFPQPIRNYD